MPVLRSINIYSLSTKYTNTFSRQLYSQVLQQITELNQQKYQQAQRDLTLNSLNFVQLPKLARQLYQYALLRQSHNINDSSNDSGLVSAKKNLIEVETHRDCHH